MIRGCIVGFILCFAAAVISGCNQQLGPPLHRVAGRGLYGGRPIVSGQVLFTPDGRRGNKGPQGLATIVEGRIDTRGTRAPGIAGGPMIVQVSGQLDATGTRFMSHEFTRDFPRDTDSELTFDIDPRDAPERGAVDF
jgi:hypothetical protein